MAAGKLRVFVVEDEALVAMLIEDMLVELGHQVVAVAGRLEEALAVGARVEADLAVVDVNLNEKRSDAVGPLLASRGIPCVYATGYGLAGVGPAQAGPVLQKPFQTNDLAQAIAQALAGTGRRGA